MSLFLAVIWQMCVRENLLKCLHLSSAVLLPLNARRKIWRLMVCIVLQGICLKFRRSDCRYCMLDVLVEWFALLCHIQEVPGPETSSFDQGSSSWLSSFSAAGLLSFCGVGNISRVWSECGQHENEYTEWRVNKSTVYFYLCFFLYFMCN